MLIVSQASFMRLNPIYHVAYVRSPMAYAFLVLNQVCNIDPFYLLSTRSRRTELKLKYRPPPCSGHAVARPSRSLLRYVPSWFPIPYVAPDDAHSTQSVLSRSAAVPVLACRHDPLLYIHTSDSFCNSPNQRQFRSTRHSRRFTGIYWYLKHLTSAISWATHEYP
ncbi:hypothetical protein BC628DRAFT_1404914 [Trametes gibbosa]|nr:hypothetical protein BC628DRAFT_1404914 [Trametes gibbosa]